ncbi:hypothetical protein M378DRAFT_26760 [Amanita muscaria Koide BX008]|uniref:Derlin n=1 Tax=Amanita muscaria (strain Koide BX008) TaxID=946122 RepID=A0A0C2WT65_AMAMK|nr:hypothetical protein M378DRAFT_26760 [Amanita muscaria Koide BX008]
MIMHLVHPRKLIFVREQVTQRYQIWRVFTSFFLASTGGISYVIELVTLYLLAEQLESGPFAGRSADFAWQLILVGIAIIIVTLPVKTPVFTHPFLVTLTCFSSLLASQGTLISLFGILYVPVIYTPFIMVGMDLLLYGAAAAIQDIVGFVVGYLWWWTMWAPVLGGRPVFQLFGRAPDWLRSLVE